MSKKVMTEGDESCAVPGRIVRGTTGGPICKGGTTKPIPYHTHDFRYEVCMGKGGTLHAVGVTDFDPASGSNHGISNPNYTMSAEDNHYHALPVRGSEPETNVKGLDILSTMKKEDKEVAETVDGWIDTIVNEMAVGLGKATDQAGMNSKDAPNPLKNPKGGPKTSYSAKKGKQPKDTQKVPIDK